LYPVIREPVFDPGSKVTIIVLSPALIPLIVGGLGNDWGADGENATESDSDEVPARLVVLTRIEYGVPLVRPDNAIVVLVFGAVAYAPLKSPPANEYDTAVIGEPLSTDEKDTFAPPFDKDTPKMSGLIGIPYGVNVPVASGDSPAELIARRRSEYVCPTVPAIV
jgi:hypothetical protein